MIGSATEMIYTSDAKPEKVSVRQAINGGSGVNVFIHEMGVPPDVWAMQAQHLKVPPPSDSAAVQRLKMVQNSSHTPQGAFGYLLSQVEPKPTLTVATHFPTSDDTVHCAGLDFGGSPIVRIDPTEDVRTGRGHVLRHGVLN